MCTIRFTSAAIQCTRHDRSEADRDPVSILSLPPAHGIHQQPSSDRVEDCHMNDVTAEDGRNAEKDWFSKTIDGKLTV